MCFYDIPQRVALLVIFATDAETCFRSRIRRNVCGVVVRRSPGVAVRRCGGKAQSRCGGKAHSQCGGKAHSRCGGKAVWW